ncbi:MAG: dephospho-CoA kinase [Candidatus Omnitrophica bacterium]|nr:dephospho-CoA kinase [Candidatus Omnitrophota bacterium]
MTLIGVTGSMGSGKTTVARILEKAGAVVIDADVLAQKAIAKPPVRKAIARCFGNDVVTGTLIDRRKLAEKVYNDRKSLDRLCRIVHPPVLKAIADEIRRLKRRLVVVDAPLLIESGLHKKMDKVIVVHVPQKTAVRRCLKRGFTADDVKRRMRFQMPFSRKKKYADFIIDNRGSVAETGAKVAAVLQAGKI